MKLFRLRKKPGSEEPERELVLDTEAEANLEASVDAAPGVPPDASGSAAGPAPAAEAETAAPVEAPGAAPAPQQDLLSQISEEADSELAREEAALAASAGGGSAEDDPLDPGLLDIFRDARNEVQESSLVAELENVSVKELLDELADVSSRLGVTGERQAANPADEAAEAPAEPPAEATAEANPEEGVQVEAPTEASPEAPAEPPAAGEQRQSPIIH